MALFGSVVSSDAQGGFSFRNKIINGDFNIWQRGTSFTSASVNEYSADRFRTEGYAHSSVISRQTFTVGQTDVPGYPTYFCRVASSTTVSAGQYWAFQQRVEAPQVMSGSGTYTLSFWVKSTTSVAAGAFQYGIDGVQSTSPALSTTWQKLTTTVSISNNQSTGYVSIYLVYFAPTKGNITVDVANVQLEYGSQATPFEKQPFGNQLTLCQRYFEKSFQQQTVPANGPNASSLIDNAGMMTGWSQNNQIGGLMVKFSVTKRTAPSLTPYGNSNGHWYAGGWGVNAIAYNLSDSGFWVNQQQTNGQALVQGHWVVSAEL